VINNEQGNDSVGSGAELVPAEITGGELDVIASRLVEQARVEGIALTGEGSIRKARRWEPSAWRSDSPVARPLPVGLPGLCGISGTGQGVRIEFSVS